MVPGNGKKAISSEQSGNVQSDCQSIKLTGAQLAQFQKVLLSAFPSKAKLAQMVSFQLDENLDAIAGGQNLSDLIFSLLQHHQAQGTLDQLLIAALTENPNNPILRDFARALQNPT